MARRTRKVWAKTVRRWAASGLTAREFSAQAGLNARTLIWWKWRLTHSEGEDDTPTGSNSESPASGAQFLELVATKPALAMTAESPSAVGVIEVVLRDGLLLRAPVDLDSRTVVRLVQSLEAR